MYPSTTTVGHDERLDDQTSMPTIRLECWIDHQASVTQTLTLSSYDCLRKMEPHRPYMPTDTVGGSER